MAGSYPSSQGCGAPGLPAKSGEKRGNSPG
jgi:hypothetical protein